MTRRAIIYTSFVIVDMLKGLAFGVLPGVEVVNIVEDGLLNDARADGGVGTRRRSEYLTTL